MIKEKGLRITTLVENTAYKRGILAEHGLCVLVETGDQTILVDTGASPYAVTHNANVLGVSLKKVDKIVISHGHWDHTGGFEAVLSAIGREVEVIAHPDIWGNRGVSYSPGTFGYAGMQFDRNNLELLGARFNLKKESTWITEDIVVSGEEPLTTDFEMKEKYLAKKLDDGTIVRDEILDDQSLYLLTEKGLVIILGCAHRGMINIIKHAIELTGETRVHMVLGGTHLGPPPNTEYKTERTIAALKELDVNLIGVSHCTGPYASNELKKAFGDKFFYNNAGEIIEL